MKIFESIVVIMKDLIRDVLKELKPEKFNFVEIYRYMRYWYLYIIYKLKMWKKWNCQTSYQET